MTNDEMSALQEQAIIIADKLLPFLPEYKVFHFSYYANDELKWDSKEVREIPEHAPYIKHFMSDQLKYVVEKTQGQWYELTDKGIEAKRAGGHYRYMEKLEKERKQLKTKERFDFLQKRFIYRWRWLPYIISIIALIVSALAYNKKSFQFKYQFDFKLATNSLGLILTIIGVYILYVNSPINRHSIDGGNASTDWDKIRGGTNKKNNLMKNSVYLVILGSLLQLLSNFIGS